MDPVTITLKGRATKAEVTRLANQVAAMTPPAPQIMAAAQPDGVNILHDQTDIGTTKDSYVLTNPFDTPALVCYDVDHVIHVTKNSAHAAMFTASFNDGRSDLGPPNVVPFRISPIDGTVVTEQVIYRRSSYEVVVPALESRTTFASASLPGHTYTTISVATRVVNVRWFRQTK